MFLDEEKKQESNEMEEMKKKLNDDKLYEFFANFLNFEKIVSINYLLTKGIKNHFEQKFMKRYCQDQKFPERTLTSQDLAWMAEDPLKQVCQNQPPKRVKEGCPVCLS